MIRSFLARLPRRHPSLTVAAATAVAAAILLVPGAIAGQGSVPPPPANPTSADQIQNIDQVKTAIKGYYGDTVTNVDDPVTTDGVTVKLCTPTLRPAPTSTRWRASRPTRPRTCDKADHSNGQASRRPPAIVLDVDDTTLNTYSYEIYSNFVFNGPTNADFVNSGDLPACPGHAGSRGARRGGRLHDLLPHGSPRGAARRERSRTSPTPAMRRPTRRTCTCRTRPTSRGSRAARRRCTRTQFKSLTRQHIESLGYDIVANFGDQFSDLNGGFADETFKIPNPMYFLP